MSSNNVSSNWENVIKGVALLSVASVSGNFNTKELQNISQTINKEGADAALKQLTEGEQYGPATGRGDYVSNTDDLRYFNSFTGDTDIGRLNNDRKEALETDKRVSLTVRPRIYNTADDGLTKRVQDILGEGGELFNHYSKSFGIIFPYTPKISGLGRTVNYEDVDILYSNMRYKQFKNSTPEKITINAKFTADTVTNAAAMLHAIWFLNACSMCKFGKETGSDAGLPPPILYLKAYDSLIDNIPVVITNYSYSLDDKDQYVHFYSQKDKEEESTINGEKNKVKVNNRGYWLPMICDITIQLDIQPNIKKTYETWTLDKYKKGELFDGLGKNPTGEFIPSGWTW